MRKLAREDVAAVAMHGNLSQNQRERALARFESGKVPTLVATDVAARGVDIDDITHVINFIVVRRRGLRPPCRPHGRAGCSGTGVTFVLPEQHDVGRLAERLGHGEQFGAAGMSTPAKPRTQSRQRRRRPR